MKLMWIVCLLVAMAACGPADRTESGPITDAAENAKAARTAAEDAAATAEAAARKIELMTQPPRPED